MIIWGQSNFFLSPTVFYKLWNSQIPEDTMSLAFTTVYPWCPDSVRRRPCRIDPLGAKLGYCTRGTGLSPETTMWSSPDEVLPLWGVGTSGYTRLPHENPSTPRPSQSLGIWIFSTEIKILRYSLSPPTSSSSNLTNPHQIWPNAFGCLIS